MYAQLIPSVGRAMCLLCAIFSRSFVHSPQTKPPQIHSIHTHKPMLILSWPANNSRLQLARSVFFFDALLSFLLLLLFASKSARRERWTMSKHNGGASQCVYLSCERKRGRQRERRSLRFSASSTCSLRVAWLLLLLFLYAPHLCVLFGQFCTWSELSR